MVQEIQAYFVDSKDVFINYLNDNNKAKIDIIKDDKHGAIKLSFTISKQGKVIKVKHDALFQF